MTGPDPWILLELADGRTTLATGLFVTISFIGSVWLLPVWAFAASALIDVRTSQRWRTVAAMAAALLMEVLLVWLLKDAVGRPRPQVVPRLVTELNGSFPSGHATAIATAMTVLVLSIRRARVPRWGLWALAAAAACIVMGLSRLYLGVHWPSDVAAGLVLGFALGCLGTWATSAARIAAPEPPG